MNDSARLRKVVVEASLQADDFSCLAAHLDVLTVDQALIGELLVTLLRARGIVQTTDDATQADRRAVFLAKIRFYLSEREPEAGPLFDSFLALVTAINLFYAELRESISKCAIRSASPILRMSAYIVRLNIAHAQFRADWRGQVENAAAYSIAGHKQYVDSEGRAASPDAFLTGIAQAYASLFAIEGREAGWFDSDGVFTLPNFVDPPESRIFEAGAVETLARIWKMWRRTEERLRFIGGSLAPASLFTSDDLREAAHVDGLVYHPVPSGIEIFDEIANDRLIDNFSQSGFGAHSFRKSEYRVSELNSEVPLVPAAYISIEEHLATDALGGLLSYDFTQDLSEYGGLRLVEWLRGYSALSRWASESFEPRSLQDPSAVIVRRSELEEMLQRWGLTASAAAKFVDRTCFRQGSRDLFDTPLVRLGQDRIVVLYPCLLLTNPAQIVLSAISSLRIKLDHKGSHFEAAVVDFLESRGFMVRKNLKIRRANQDYQFDVLARWENFIFVFECKSRALSMGSPVLAYTLSLERHESSNQLNRLIDFLNSDPSVLTGLFGADARELTIVPIVLNAMPFSLPGLHNGVFYSDWSSLRRFFLDRYLTIGTPYEFLPGRWIMHQLPLADLWDGDRPTPEALIEFIYGSPQLALSMAHSVHVDYGFAVSDQLAFVTTEIHRTEMTVESMASVYRLDPARLRTAMEEFRAKASHIGDANSDERSPRSNN